MKNKTLHLSRTHHNKPTPQREFSKPASTPKNSTARSDQTTSGNDVYLYGHHPVSLALENKKRVIKEIFMLSSLQGKFHINTKIPVHFVLKEQLESLVGKEAIHQGIVAKCRPLENENIDSFVSKLEQKDKALVVILDQVTDPHNIGAILRSAAAFNADAVIIPQANAPQETGVLAKSASGSLELIQLLRVANLVRTIEKLKSIGFWCIGLDGYAKQSIYETKLPKKCILVMGSEGEGMRRLTQEACDITVKLPMNPKVESLNVSNACAVSLYEWNRQYQGK